MFCFVLFCFVLFCFVLFCFVLFCFVLFCFVLFCFALLCFALLCFALLCFALFVLLIDSFVRHWDAISIVSASRPSLKSAIKYNYTIDNRDNAALPTKGTFLRVKTVICKCVSAGSCNRFNKLICQESIELLFFNPWEIVDHTDRNLQVWEET